MYTEFNFEEGYRMFGVECIDIDECTTRGEVQKSWSKQRVMEQKQHFIYVIVISYYFFHLSAGMNRKSHHQIVEVN